MVKIIVIFYSENNDWESESWHSIKCLTYSKKNMLRVKKYLKKLMKFIKVKEFPKNQYDVFQYKQRVSDVTDYLKGEKKHILSMFENNSYRDGVTVKLYENGEMLPYEQQLLQPNFFNDLENGKADIQFYKCFGNHADYKVEAETGQTI